MKIYKENAMLVFDFENGKTVKYNLESHVTIGLKGKPVQSLNHQLRGLSMYNIIMSCVDKNYADFLRLVNNNCPNLDNVGSILSRAWKYKNLEQICSAGLGKNIALDFKGTIHDIPKSLRKLAKKRNIRITDILCEKWRECPDLFQLPYKLKFITLNDEDIYKVLTSRVPLMMGSCFLSKDFKYLELINEYGYNAKSLFLYLDYLKTFEALEDMTVILTEIKDYANMMRKISDKYDKYPRHFLTTHRIACRNYNRFKQEFPEKLFKDRINTSYECSFHDYVFIYPKCTQDIKDEAAAQSNCVISYIDNVIEGKCHIMFLRKKSNPDTSLVTLEIQNNRIVQAKRRFNDSVNDEEQEAIDWWNEKFADKEKGEKAA